MKIDIKEKIKQAIRKIDLNNIDDEIEITIEELDLTPKWEDYFLKELDTYKDSLEKTCQKYKPKENKSYILANGILEAMCLNNDLNTFINSNVFKEFKYYIDTRDEDKIDNILVSNKDTFKESLRLLKCLKLINHKQPEYALLTKNWFNKSTYEILDNDVLQKIIPLLLGYLGKHHEATIHSFFDNIDILIKYIIKPAVEHNNIHFIEKQILEAIEELESVTIKLKDKEVSIIPIKIIYKTNSNKEAKKVLVYETVESSDEYEILFDEIERISIDSSSSDFAVEDINNQSYMFNPQYSNLSIDSHTKTSNDIKLLLELDTQIVEYYQIKPLNNQKLYLTKEEKIEFSKTFHYESIKNKCYLSAEDLEDNIISTILHTLDYVKIITPTSINDKIASKFKNYLKKSNVDICSDNLQKTNDEDLDKDTESSQDIKNKKAPFDGDNIEFSF